MNIKRILFFISLINLMLTAKAQTWESNVVIVNDKNLSYVIDVPNGKVFDGAKLQVWEHYSNTPIQHFKVEKRGDHKVLRSAINEGFAFDIPNGDLYNGNQVQLWTAYPDNNIQRWSIERIPNTNIMIIRSALDPSYVLSVEKPVRNGSKLIIEKYTGDSNQKWIFMEATNNPIYLLYKSGYDNNH